MQSLVFFLFFIGVFIIVNAIYQQKYDALSKNVRVEYRFIPKTYYEEQLAADTVSSNFASLFSKTSPWFNANIGDPIVAVKGEGPDNNKIAGVLAGNKMKT